MKFSAGGVAILLIPLYFLGLGLSATAGEVVFQAKGKQPVVPFTERSEIVSHVDYVDEVVTDTSSDKVVMWRQVHFDVLFKGDDWRGTPKGDRLEADLARVGARVVYFPYTVHTSSTMLRDFISDN